MTLTDKKKSTTASKKTAIYALPLAHRLAILNETDSAKSRQQLDQIRENFKLKNGGEEFGEMESIDILPLQIA